ncbi:AraC family transcriptional regulator [Burkholderia plantarii]|nr:AraC family transcriptional regulator [Burkholderia plantarii]
MAAVGRREPPLAANAAAALEPAASPHRASGPDRAPPGQSPIGERAETSYDWRVPLAASCRALVARSVAMSPFAVSRSAAQPPVDHLPFENTPRPVAAMAARYPHGTLIAPHRHRRAQLLYAIEGVMQITAETGAWVVPPTRGVWLEAGLDHAVRMSGDVQMRTVFVEPSVAQPLRARTGVVDVPPLLRELIVAAIDVPLDYQPGSRDDHLMQLILAELISVPQLPLHLPWPRDARLRAVCDALLASPHDDRTVAEWAGDLGMSEKTLYRWFNRETGLTFGRWRQQARLLLALQRLAHGEKILSVALDHGYRSQSAFTAMFKRHFGVAPSAFYD